MLGSNGMPVGMNNRMRTDPIPVQRTQRPMIYRTLTSGNAGKMLPVLAMPLLREDSVSGARFRIALQMDETVEVLMNSVNVRVMTYLVPRLAFARFDGLDSLNRSYEGVAMTNGGTTPPWFQGLTTEANPAINQVHHTLGKHSKPGTVTNDDYVEAYNQIWNFRAKNRSPHLTQRNLRDWSLAPAFWNHQAWAHVVPDFDQAIIDGEVPLSIGSVNLSGPPYVNIVGIGTTRTATATASPTIIDGSGAQYAYTSAIPINRGTDDIWFRTGSAGPDTGPFLQADLRAVYDEMTVNGVTLSLSNIELARKTQAFANLRRQYNGYSDEYIIDLLMDGITIPDQAWKQPMLLSDESTIFGMSKRWASDGGNLTESVVNGATFIDFGFSCPRVGCGGVIMVVVEIAPEQLFERQRDPYLHATAVSELPQFLRDTLDPEKVEVVTNGQVDVLHDNPNATFGYAPLNHAWAKSMPCVGGRYMRPADDSAFDEARQRIWAVETKNPVLGPDFYLCTQMHYKPFVVTDDTQDHFEIMVSGTATINGNTVFGSTLIEATDDYDTVLAKAPQDRISKGSMQDEVPSQQPSPEDEASS